MKRIFLITVILLLTLGATADSGYRTTSWDTFRQWHPTIQDGFIVGFANAMMMTHQEMFDRVSPATAVEMAQAVTYMRVPWDTYYLDDVRETLELYYRENPGSVYNVSVEQALWLYFDVLNESQGRGPGDVIRR